MMCDRCEELAERVRQLEAELYNTSWEAPSEIGLTRMEARMVSAMVARDRTCTQAFLILATRDCAGTKADYPDSNLIDAKICHIRRKLRPFGLSIETIWGVGFKLSPESRFRLLNWQSAEAA